MHSVFIKSNRGHRMGYVDVDEVDTDNSVVMRL